MIDTERLLAIMTDLCSYAAPSGSESALEAPLRSYVGAHADEIYVDALGSVIARHKASGPHVLVTAHVDEPGLMVIDITDDGFLHVVPIGSLDATQFVGRMVQWTNGRVGFVGAADSVSTEDLTFDDLYVDVGAISKNEAQEIVPIGTGGVLTDDVKRLANGRLTGRALHNRAGAAIAIAAFEAAAVAGHNVSVAFTAQRVVGARGARTVAFALKPDCALVIDAAMAGDVPDGPRSAVRLGQGPAIRLLDHGIIVPPAMKTLLLDAAAAADIHVQYDVQDTDISDAGAIEATADGILVGGLGYPVRGIGCACATIDLADVVQTANLAVAAIAKAADSGR